MKKIALFLLLFLQLWLPAQNNDSLKRIISREYDRKEEIISNGKRYRIHNTYLTLGPGFLGSSIRDNSQRSIAVDFHFPVRWQHFQIGGFMSGPGFSSNNNSQLHVGIGKRRENARSNFAFYAGPSYFWGVTGEIGTPAVYYQGLGLYGNIQAVTKFTYDIGMGLELFGEVSTKQRLVGFKIIVFFSGAYRGEKRNYNPNVRSERQK